MGDNFNPSFAIPMNNNTIHSWLPITTRTPSEAHEKKEMSILPQDPTIAGAPLDGSCAQLIRLLRELVDMTGQEAQALPVLELQLGDILTRTTVQTEGGNYLLITASLPKCCGATYLSQSSEAVSLQVAQGIEYLWHADEGRHFGVCKVPIKDLPDERSVMDAILTTSDQASAWFGAMSAH